MTDSNVIQNRGGFFADDAIDHLAASTLLSQEELDEMLEQLIEHYEHHNAYLNDSTTASQVGFFFVNRALHVLGYTHSHHEPLGEDYKFGYTLFSSPEMFSAYVVNRGTVNFFSGAVGVGKLAPWAMDLGISTEAAGEGNPSAESNAFDLEEKMRLTNIPWAILTSGRVWRLYHRNTIAMVNTCLEVDLEKIIKERDKDSFKVFATAFCAKAINADNSGSSENRRLLA